MDLREFYAGALGEAARRLVLQRILARWPNLRGARLLGLGYAAPYLEALGRESELTLAFCPARLGAIGWPQAGPSRSALVDEADLPLADSSMDFVLVVHGLELAEELPGLLGEVFRVLAPQGRALFIAPNRRGLWARFDSTPFGHGRPFSRGQMSRLLRQAQFSALGWSQCLFLPPSPRAYLVRSASAIERVGQSVFPGFAGLLMVEAVKQVYAIPQGRRVRRLMPRMPVLRPVPALRDHRFGLESGPVFCHCSGHDD